jgi:hypothetical protein
MFKHLAHFLCAPSELFLKFANQLVILAFSVGEVVVGQLSVLLFELTFHLIPGAFELKLVHMHYSARGGDSVVLDPRRVTHLSPAIIGREVALPKKELYSSASAKASSRSLSTSAPMAARIRKRKTGSEVEGYRVTSEAIRALHLGSVPGALKFCLGHLKRIGRWSIAQKARRINTSKISISVRKSFP